MEAVVVISRSNKGMCINGKGVLDIFDSPFPFIADELCEVDASVCLATLIREIVLVFAR